MLQYKLSFLLLLISAQIWALDSNEMFRRGQVPSDAQLALRWQCENGFQLNLRFDDQNRVWQLPGHANFSKIKAKGEVRNGALVFRADSAPVIMGAAGSSAFFALRSINKADGPQLIIESSHYAPSPLDRFLPQKPRSEVTIGNIVETFICKPDIRHEQQSGFIHGNTTSAVK